MDTDAAGPYCTVGNHVTTTTIFSPPRPRGCLSLSLPWQLFKSTTLSISLLLARDYLNCLTSARDFLLCGCEIFYQILQDGYSLNIGASMWGPFLHQHFNFFSPKPRLSPYFNATVLYKFLLATLFNFLFN